MLAQIDSVPINRYELGQIRFGRILTLKLSYGIINESRGAKADLKSAAIKHVLILWQRRLR